MEQYKINQLINKIQNIKTLNLSKEEIQKSFSKEELKIISDVLFSVEIEKSHAAVIGEIRDWGGTKYKKVGAGKWEEVREIGHIPVSIGGKMTPTQTSAAKHVEFERRNEKAEEAAKARAYKNSAEFRKKVSDAWEKVSDLKSEIYDLRNQLEDNAMQRTQLNIDMEHEIGSIGSEWDERTKDPDFNIDREKDIVGNRYGGELNELDEKYDQILQDLKTKVQEHAEAEEMLYELKSDFNEFQHMYDEAVRKRRKR